MVFYNRKIPGSSSGRTPRSGRGNWGSNPCPGAMKKLKRCEWVKEDDELMAEYHDREWGVPLQSDNKIFEFLVLESFQAGLSWRTILNKRKNFERTFAKFNPAKVAEFRKKDIAKLLKDKGIIRNRAKIEPAVCKDSAQLLPISSLDFCGKIEGNI